MDAIIEYIEANDTIEGAPGLKEEHLPVFDCAFKPKNGKRYIPYLAHIRMMSAVQPFLSGAISKTVNMPNEATVDEIMQTYLEGWKLGLKALAIYRDGCKRSQPVNTGKKEEKTAAEVTPGGNGSKARPLRRRMPTTRQSITHKFDISGHEGYLTVGLYDDGQPGELFITMAKEGSTIGGLMDSFGTAISLCLQYGVPVKTLVEKFAHSRFEPSGFTKNPDIPIAKSLTDYIFRWMGHTFLEGFKVPAPTKSLQPENGNGAQGRRVEEGGRESDGTAEVIHSGQHEGGDGCAAIERHHENIPGRRAGLRPMRRDHRPQRRLLPLLQLRQLDGMLVERRPLPKRLEHDFFGQDLQDEQVGEMNDNPVDPVHPVQNVFHFYGLVRTR